MGEQAPVIGHMRSAALSPELQLACYWDTEVGTKAWAVDNCRPPRPDCAVLSHYTHLLSLALIPSAFVSWLLSPGHTLWCSAPSLAGFLLFFPLSALGSACCPVLGAKLLLPARTSDSQSPAGQAAPTPPTVRGGGFPPIWPPSLCSTECSSVLESHETSPGSWEDVSDAPFMSLQREAPLDGGPQRGNKKISRRMVHGCIESDFCSFKEVEATSENWSWKPCSKFLKPKSFFLRWVLSG